MFKTSLNRILKVIILKYRLKNIPFSRLRVGLQRNVKPKRPSHILHIKFYFKIVNIIRTIVATILLPVSYHNLDIEREMYAEYCYMNQNERSLPT